MNDYFARFFNFNQDEIFPGSVSKGRFFGFPTQRKIQASHRLLQVLVIAKWKYC